MPIQVTGRQVSDVQKDYLRRAKARPTSEAAIDALLRVCRDSDITSGRETVDPGWTEIFGANLPQLKSHLPEQEFASLEQLFGKAEVCDPDVLKIDLVDAHILFLLGAGASKPSGIPTVTQLLPDLLQRARRLNRQDLNRLADFCDESKIDNIEDLLTAAQLSEFCSRNPIVLRLIEFLIYRKGRDEAEPFIYSAMRGYTIPRAPLGDLSAVAFLQETLQVLFGLLSSRMLPAKPNAAHRAIAKHAQANKGSSIVTTNYDCCIDLALGTEDKTFSYLIDFANRKASTSPSRPLCPLIKLHGSLNWFYCETCQQVYLIDIKKAVREYLADENCYSVIAVCRGCGGQRRGLLVPPLVMKFDLAPPLTPLIERAQEAFNNADIIVAVGFSFAEADLYISRMLTKPLQSSKDVKVVVFDPDYGVVDRLRRQMSLRISSFQPDRILRVAGDCSQMLPAFLSGKLRSLVMKSKSSPPNEVRKEPSQKQDNSSDTRKRSTPRRKRLG